MNEGSTSENAQNAKENTQKATATAKENAMKTATQNERKTEKGKKMKKLVFGYVCDNAKIRRTYGGVNYTLSAWELTGGKVVRLGDISRCTSGHKGESSEAWGCILENRKGLVATLNRRAKITGVEFHFRDSRSAYCPNWSDMEKLGIELINMGGARA